MSSQIATGGSEGAELGIRAEVCVGDPMGCPVAAISSDHDTSVNDVNRSVSNRNGTVTEDFTISADVSIDDVEATEIFNTDAESTYRFTRPAGDDCICDSIEQFDLTASDIRSENGELVVTFYAPNFETIKEVISMLREGHDTVSLRHLSQSGDAGKRELVIVDRSRLTDRQREVIETAYEMGYFDHPKGANAGQVAEELGIATSTFSEHLSAAQSKILDGVLET